MAEHLAPIDESVKIPAAVARAAAAAEAHYNQPAPDVDRADATVQIEPTPAPAVEPTPEPAPAVEPTPEPTPEPAPAEPNWEHRYRSMEGRVKQLTEINHSLSDNLQQLSTTVNERFQQQQPTRPLVTDEERKAYGDDLLSVVERQALQAVQPHISRLAEENQQLRHRVARDEARTIYEILGVELPNWRAINTSQEFLRWLALPDLYSGQVRSGLLKAAFGAGEAGRVLAFFRGFLAEHPELGWQQTAAPQPTPAASAPARQAAVQLKDLAAPGKARPATGNSPVPAEPIVITNKDIDRFYTDVRRGVYAGRTDAKDAAEAKIYAAVRENRVRHVK